MDPRGGVSPIRNEELGDCSPATIKDKAAIDLVRMKEAMVNQCFEMSVQASLAVNQKRLVDDDADVSLYEHSLQETRTKLHNLTLALNRMQVWDAIEAKIIRNDESSGEMKMLAHQGLNRFTRIQKLQQESRELQEQITEMQKERLVMKDLIKKAKEEMATLKNDGHGEGEVDRASLEKADQVVDKHRKFIALSQNILRGIILATRINWKQDPKLADIMMAFESLPN